MRWLPVFLLAGCFPEFADQPWLVDGPQILGIRGDPAEARVNEQVFYEALAVSADGEILDAAEWSYCVQPRSADERTGVTASCLEGRDLEPISASTTILSDACSRFGPNPPPVEANESPRRPADPDPSGGYFLPVQAQVEGAEAFGFQRIRCDLAGATRDVFDAFQDGYTDNLHPEIDDSTRDLEVSTGEVVELFLRPTTESAEPYVVYSAEDSRLYDAVEDLTVWWYVTGGRLSHGSRAVTGGEAVSTWSAPDEPAEVYGWMILRDSRGGLTWTHLAIDVQ